MRHSILFLCALAPLAAGAGVSFPQSAPPAGAVGGTPQLQHLHVDERPSGRLQVALLLDGQTAVIDLAPHDVRTPGFQTWIEDADGLAAFNLGAPATYRGSVLDDPGALVAGNYRSGWLTAVVLPGDRSSAWSIEPASDTGTLYSVRRADDAFAADFCRVLTAARPVDVPPPSGDPEGAATKQHAEIALDSDFNFYSLMGFDAQATSDYMLATLAIASLVFENDLDVVLRVPTVLVRTDPDAPNYPYVGQNADLDEIEDWWANETSISFDTVHLFTGRSMGLGIGGMAWIQGLCRETPSWRKSGMSRAPQADLPSMIYIATHEIGHNFGSFHSSEGVMQASGVTGDLFFSGQSATWINNWLAQITCLTDGSDGSFAPVVTGVSPSSIDLATEPVFSVLGQNMGSVIQIDIGGETLYYGDFVQLSNGELQVTYTPDVLGAHGMTLRSPVGSDQATITFVEPATPVLREPLVYEPIGNRYSRWTTVAGPGDSATVVYNLDGQTTMVGGWPVLKNRITIGMEQGGPNGVTGQVEWAPDPSLYDITVYAQAIVFDAETGAFSTTNVRPVCHGPIGPCE